jgi:hypothetical protein
MKKIMLSLPIIALLTGCGSNVDLVKDGVMEFNQTTTLGKVLDNWRSCQNTDWDEFETDNGVSVVQFTCEHEVEDFMEKIKSYSSKEGQEKADYLEVISDVQRFQFTLNQDDSFQIDNVQVDTIWRDGTRFNDSQKPVEQLEIAYMNELYFNPKLLNENTADEYAYTFAIMKSRAK